MKSRLEDKDLLAQAIRNLETPEEVYDLLVDLTTEKEFEELANRFRIAKLLSEQWTFKEIEELTGTSSATISRVSRSLKKGKGYKRSLQNLELTKDA